MQIGTQNVPSWEFACGELGKAAPTLEIEPVEASPLVEAMPLGRMIQGAEMVHELWMAVGSVED